MSFIVKITLSGLAFALSLQAAEKTQYFFHLSFNITLQLINGIPSDLQKFIDLYNFLIFYQTAHYHD